MTINVGIYRIKIFMYPTITIMLLFHFVGVTLVLYEVIGKQSITKNDLFIHYKKRKVQQRIYYL